MKVATLVAVLALLGLPFTAQATAILETKDWNSAGVASWTDEDYWTGSSGVDSKDIEENTKPASKLFTENWPPYIQPDSEAETVSSLFANYAEWENNVDRARFVSELGNRDWIDAYVWRVNLHDPVYGIDNYSLAIPEPHTAIMLVAAGTAAVLSFRRRRSNSNGH